MSVHVQALIDRDGKSRSVEALTAQLTSATTALENSSSRCSALTKEVDNLQDDLLTALQRVQQLDTERYRLTEQCSAVQADLDGHLVSAFQERCSLLSQLRQAESRCDGLHRELTEFRGHHDHLLVELTCCRDEVAVASGDRDAVTAQQGDLKAQLADALSSCSLLQQQIAEQSQELHGQAAEIRTLQHQYDVAQHEFVTSKSHSAAMEASFSVSLAGLRYAYECGDAY